MTRNEQKRRSDDAELDLIDTLEEFAHRYYKEDIQQTDAYNEPSLAVEYSDIVAFDPELADALEEEPIRILDALFDAINRVTDEAEPEPRIAGTPNETPIREIRNEHLGTLVSVDGIISQASEVKAQIDEAVFKCAICGTLNEITQYSDELREPDNCPNCDRKTPHDLRTGMSEWRDVQHLRIQESPDDLRAGETPTYIDTEVFGELCHRVAPGDRVSVVGVVREEKYPEVRQMSLRLETNNIVSRETDMDSVELSDEDRERIREVAEQKNIEDALVRSFAPSIHGYETEKRAMLYQLFGAPIKHLSDGTRKRGDAHILLIGDPGVGKSQLIEYAHEVAPRSVHTSAKNATGVGLTATAEQDDFGDSTEWTIKPGALPMADKGLIAVDELDKTTPEARGALHEALEQQQVSYSKANKTGQFKARCSLIAAANPKHGRFDRFEGVVEQVDLEPALLSRFDMIFPLMDEPDEASDTELGEHILETIHDSQDDGRDGGHASPEYSPEFLRKYISYARRKVDPVLSEDAKQHLNEWWVSLRNENNDGDAIPATPRQLEAAERLAEASARVRLSETVVVEDAQRATAILMSSLLQVGRDPDTGDFDIDVIESGVSSSQRSQINDLKEVIQEVSEDGSADESEVAELCEELDIMSSEKAHERIGTLATEGELVRPTRGEVRLV
jgi:replicative DNA helicase Mcm